MPGGEREASEERLHERRLARPVGTDECDPIGPGNIEGERAERELAPFDDSVVETHDDVAGPGSLADGEAEVPSLPRLLDGLERVEGTFGPARPSRQRLGPLNAELPLRLVVVAGLFLLPGHTGGRPLAFALGPLPQLAPLRLVDGVVGGGVRLIGRTLAPVRRPATAIGAAVASMLVEFEDIGHRAFQEGPVVRHDHHAAGTAGHDVLESGQAVEVEIVRRFVEQRDVETREQDGGKGDPCLLSTRERGHGLLDDLGRKSHLRGGAHEASLEVAGRRRFVTGQSGGVPIVGLRAAGGERGRRCGQLVLHRGDTGSAGQRRADGLVPVRRVLLAQVAHRRRGRVHLNLPRRRHQEAGQDQEERRLPDPVRTDDAETGVGTDGERDVVEDGVAAALVVEVVGDQGRVRCCGRGWHEGSETDGTDEDVVPRAADAAAAGDASSSTSPRQCTARPPASGVLPALCGVHLGGVL